MSDTATRNLVPPFPLSDPGRKPGRAVAVIGSGFGGLAAAIRLQAAGLQVTLFEARDKPGGRAYVYENDGYTFDAGPTVITAPQCLEELFAAAGRRLEDYVTLLPVEPMYRLQWDDGDQLDYTADLEDMLAQIRKRNPKDADGYQRFLEYSKKVFAKGYEELVDVPFLRFSDMVRVAPDLARLRADRSVYKTVSRYVSDDHLRQALSFHSLLVGGNPFETSAIYTLIHYLERKWGVFFPKGGTGALIRALVRVFEELGGTLHLNAPVQEVTLVQEDGQTRHCVHWGDGQTLDAEAVVSNADVHHTYARLYRSHPEAQATQRRLERSAWSMSLFVLYFGTDRNYDIAHHTVLFGPRYKELLQDIFHGSRLPDDFSLYLHAPTVTDPDLAPPGCGAYYVLSPVPHLGNANIDWETAGPAYADRILAYLERSMPDLRKHVVTKHWMTPCDFRDTLKGYHGAAFSLAPTLTQSAWFRPHNRDPKIPGLYITGAGTHPGAGVPGVVNAGKATAGVLLADMGVKVS
ncbi:MAG: phytoene desaturase [Candidatus Hydrogenedentes bacterium]|nr:phytoene desaturase [Candidatus Hydrogenedentota bacterium]